MNEAMQTKPGGRSLRGADGLRAIACLMVIFHHLSQELILNPAIRAPEFIKAIATFFNSVGSAGVSVFFVLSGFLLSTPFWENYLEGKAMPDLRVYAARRAGRIMPGFYLNLFFFFLVGLFLYPDAPAVTLRYFAGLSFTAGFNWLTLFPAEMNGPLWSIGFEVVSYLLMPLGMFGLFAFGRNKRSFGKAMAWWAGLWVLMLGANQLIQNLVVYDDIGKGWMYGQTGGAKFWMPRYNPIGFFGHFSLGVMAAGLTAHWSRAPRSPRRARRFDLAALACLVAWLALMVSRSDQDQFSMTIQGQPYYFPLFPGLCALLLACLTQGDLMSRLFDNRFFRYTARISFGLYLWHYLVINRFNGGISDWGEWLILVAVVLPLSYGIASLSWRYVEEPILRRVQAWKPRTKGEPFRMTRFAWGISAAIAGLVIVPAALGGWYRPQSWQVPLATSAWYGLKQQGPVNGVAFAPGGTMYLSTNGREITSVSPDKTDRLIYRLAGDSADVRLGFSRNELTREENKYPDLSILKNQKPYLWNLRVGPDGNLYVAAGLGVLVLSPSGQQLHDWPLALRGEFGVTDLAFGPAGQLYAANADRVYRIAPDGRPELLLDGAAADGPAAFANAAGLALSADGRSLWVVDYRNHQRESSRLLQFDLSEARAPRLLQALSAPGALSCALAANGDLFCADAFSGSLYRLGGNGRLERLPCLSLRLNSTLAFGDPGLGSAGLFTAAWDGTVSQIAIDQPGARP